MDFNLSEEQEMMQTLARDFLADQYPEKVLRAVAAGDGDAAAPLWRQMAEMNLMGLSLPEEYGGLGDLLDLVVVLEEMGKACFISPYFASVVLGAGAISLAGSPEQQAEYLPAIAEGKLKATLAAPGPGAAGITAARQGDGYRLNGEAPFVPDAQTADIIVAAAKDAGGRTTLFIAPGDAAGLVMTPVKLISGEPSARIAFENVTLDGSAVLGPEGDGEKALDIVLQMAAVGRCAIMCGLSRRALDLTLDYAKERVAFGHPIGAFQSLQHRCADMLMDAEGSRFLTYQAAWKLASGQPAAREVAIAKAWVGSAARRVMHSAHQAHGAIGFSEDHVLHFYTKMTRACEFSFGDVDYHYNNLVKLSL
jgi:alkylation response protein AidB-like acyl-CoA dehydrogenase